MDDLEDRLREALEREAQVVRPSPPRLDIIEIKTGRVVDSIPLTHTDDQYVDRVMAGLLRNMNKDKFFVQEVF